MLSLITHIRRTAADSFFTTCLCSIERVSLFHPWYYIAELGMFGPSEFIGIESGHDAPFKATAVTAINVLDALLGIQLGFRRRSAVDGQ